MAGLILRRVTLKEAVVLAIVQGLTEFLPISSSGHLALAENLLGMKDLEKNLLVTLILHMASLLAVVAYYNRRLFRISKREIAFLAIATIPILAVGAAFSKQIEALQGMPVVICIALIVNGVFLAVSERFKGEQPMDEAPEWKAILIGVAQAVLIPGLSRSGRTIGTGWMLGISRPDAVRFSFFLSIPAVVAAFSYKLFKHRNELSKFELPLGTTAIGFVLCFVLSLASIRVVELLSGGRKWLTFSVYCVVAGTAGLVWFLRA
jgi:undecaprenyl-diphosphatase